MKKAQAAMEFLMTYGWAILVVLIAIGALAYFGVLNPSRFLPSSCTLAPGLACTDFKVVDATTDTVTIYIRNGMGASLDLTADATACPSCGITLTTQGATSACTAGTTQAGSIADGAVGTFQFSCADPGSVADRYKGAISIVYKKSGDTLTHTITGDITTKVE